MHTNRTLQTLRREGLIQLNARSLVVLDWPFAAAISVILPRAARYSPTQSVVVMAAT